MADDLRLLIVTTHNDPSLELLISGSEGAGMGTMVLRYGPDATMALRQRYDIVYFRDPFNDTTAKRSTIEATIEQVHAAQPHAYYVDRVSSFHAMLLEDKWEQYRNFGNAMPPTSLLESFDHVPMQNTFVKKRISSRSRGIILTADDIPVDASPEDYLVQQKLDIVVEYRIFMIKGRPVLPVAIKSNKTAIQRSKVIGLEHNIDAAVRALCEQIYVLTGYDFMGLDVVRAGDRYYLLEANRSCQFKAFHRLTGTNLAEQLCQELRTTVAA